jgi:hypothetical protein
MDAVRRWGGMGPFDYAYRYGSEADRNVGGFTSLTKTFAGPLPQDAIDAILYRKGLSEIVVTNLPGYAAYDMVFGDGTKKELRRMARGTPADKPKKPVLYAKGGLVYDVPNVTDEPDEMKSRVTGMPFNATAEFVQDEEDRALKGQMSRMGFEEGGKVSLADLILSTIKKLRNYSDDEINILKEHADLVANAESDRIADRVQTSGGPGRGKYQYEISTPEKEGQQGAKTAVNRYINFKEKANLPITEEDVKLLLDKNPDFSQLPEDLQDAIFYADKVMGKLPVTDLVKGKLSQEEAWVDYHWAGNQEERQKKLDYFKVKNYGLPKEMEKEITRGKLDASIY